MSVAGALEPRPVPLGIVGNSMTSLPVALDASALHTSSKILQIIDRYRMVSSPSIDRADESALKFIALTYTHVKAGRAVPMCLPAFPFKSPNSVSKVLGNLPDKAEEFALARLNGLCQAIGDVYTPGAKLTIISDGLVYNGQLPRHSAIGNSINVYKICSVCLIKMFGLTARLSESSPSTKASRTFPSHDSGISSTLNFPTSSTR